MDTSNKKIKRYNNSEKFTKVSSGKPLVPTEELTVAFTVISYY